MHQLHSIKVFVNKLTAITWIGELHQISYLNTKHGKKKGVMGGGEKDKDCLFFFIVFLFFTFSFF